MAGDLGSLVLRLGLDGSGFNSGITELNRQMKLVQSGFQAARAGLGDFGSGLDGLKLKSTNLAAQMGTQQTKVSLLEEAHRRSVAALGADARATQELEIRLNQARTSLSNMENELRRTNADIDLQSSALYRLGESLNAAGDRMKVVGQQMTNVGRSLSLAVTAPLLAVGAAAGKASIDFESAFAGVKKTIDATDAEFASLRQGIRNMSKEMPAAATEIAKVEEAAGQLGIKNENIEGFTKVMVNMGVATNLSSDQAATALARMANITQMPQKEFSNLGSSIVALGNNMATTESDIVAMGLRLVGAGHQIGLTEAQTLGFSAALSSVGIEAEAGGSAVSKVMIDIASEVATGGEKLKGFSQVAGMSVKDFQKSFKEDAAGTIATFIEGLGKMSTSGQNVFGVLDDLGLSEIRVRDALLRASGAGDLFRKSIDLSSQAWKDNTALANEAEQRYKTTASQLQIMKNRLTDIGITLGDTLIPVFMKFLSAMQPVFDLIEKSATWFSGLDTGVQTTILAIAGIAVAIGPALVVIGTLISSIGTIVAAFGSVSGAVAAVGGAMAILTGPVGLTIAAVVGLGAALVLLYKNNEDVRNALSAAWEAIQSAAISIFDALKEFWAAWGDDIINFFKVTWEVIKLAFTVYFEIYFSIIKTVFNAIKAFWDKWGGTITQTFKNEFEILKIIWGTAFEVIFAVVTFIFNQLKDFWDDWGGTIIGVFTTWFKIISDVFSTAWNAIKIVVETAMLVISKSINVILAVLKGDWAGAWTEIKGIFEAEITGVLRILGNMKDSFFRIGKDVVQGLIDGISNMIASVENTVRRLASTVSSGVSSALGIHSPSRVMMELGVYTGEGFALGIQDSIKKVNGAVKQLSTASIPDISSIGGNKSGFQGNIQVMVTGNHLSGEADENRLAEKISRMLAGQYGLRVGGAF